MVISTQFQWPLIGGDGRVDYGALVFSSYPTPMDIFNGADALVATAEFSVDSEPGLFGNVATVTGDPTLGTYCMVPAFPQSIKGAEGGRIAGGRIVMVFV